MFTVHRTSYRSWSIVSHFRPHSRLSPEIDMWVKAPHISNRSFKDKLPPHHCMLGSGKQSLFQFLLLINPSYSNSREILTWSSNISMFSCFNKRCLWIRVQLIIILSRLCWAEMCSCCLAVKRDPRSETPADAVGLAYRPAVGKSFPCVMPKRKAPAKVSPAPFVFTACTRWGAMVCRCVPS